jgi:hypothetical protein
MQNLCGPLLPITAGQFYILIEILGAVKLFPIYKVTVQMALSSLDHHFPNIFWWGNPFDLRKILMELKPCV